MLFEQNDTSHEQTTEDTKPNFVFVNGLSTPTYIAQRTQVLIGIREKSPDFGCYEFHALRSFSAPFYCCCFYCFRSLANVRLLLNFNILHISICLFVITIVLSCFTLFISIEFLFFFFGIELLNAHKVHIFMSTRV